MKNATKIASLILALVFIFSLASCGTLNPAISSDSQSDTEVTTDTSTETDTSTDSDIGFGDETGYSETAFTVALRYKGEKYTPSEQITVYWKNESTLESSALNSNGYAGSERLDGDFKVSISGLKEGMVYNPNAYVATNDNRNIIIDVRDIEPTTGRGKDEYNGIRLAKAAVYSVTLKSAKEIIYFDFFPRESGMYVVESWMDVGEGKINPLCDVYLGTTVYKNFDQTVDGGGAEGVYTKNFKTGINVNDDMIGNVLTFGIHADAISTDNYPVTIIFAVTLNGSFDEITNHEYEMYAPKDLDAYREGCVYYDSSYEIVYAETPIPGRDNTYEFVNDNYKLWRKEELGDGYYHVYDMEKYSREKYPNGYKDGYPEGYGPILYAQVSQPCRFLDKPFTNFETYGKTLSIKVSEDLRLNYKHFIEGYTALAKRIYDGQTGKYLSSYYCYLGCPCHPIEQLENYACLEGCTKCLPDCRNVRREFVTAWDENGNPISYFEGIQAYSVVNGGVAVSEELKVFLERLNIAQRYFADGEGWMENHETIHVDAADDSMWLFPCFYFEKKN